MLRCFIGFDPAEQMAWNVARRSLINHSSVDLDISRIALPELRARALYTRPTVYPTIREPRYWDEISQAPMSTGHAIARFLVPALCDYKGWALFTDGDVLFRDDVAKLFALVDPQHAVSVVQHEDVGQDGVKKGGHAQQAYRRKGWSSVMVLNCGHPSNRALTPELVNSLPGRDLHAFCWLQDEEIGALPGRWNVLIGQTAADDVAVAHYTFGVPSTAGYESQQFADEWRRVARAVGYRQPEAVPA